MTVLNERSFSRGDLSKDQDMSTMNMHQPVYDQYEEFEERDPRKKLDVSEAYQIEDLKRDRAYLKREIAKQTTEKHEVILSLLLHIRNLLIIRFEGKLYKFYNYTMN